MTNLLVALVETVGLFGVLALTLIFLTLFVGSAVWAALDARKRGRGWAAIGLLLLLAPPALALAANYLPKPGPFFVALLTWPLALTAYTLARPGAEREPAKQQPTQQQQQQPRRPVRATA